MTRVSSAPPPPGNFHSSASCSPSPLAALSLADGKNSPPPTVIESFDDMGLKEDLLRGIYSYGFEKPSAIQQRAIKPLIMMRDTIAQAQSGTGKTATFTIGAPPTPTPRAARRRRSGGRLPRTRRRPHTPPRRPSERFGRAE